MAIRPTGIPVVYCATAEADTAKSSSNKSPNKRRSVWGDRLVLKTLRLLWRARMDVHLGPDVVRRWCLVQRGDLRVERPFEGAQAAGAEFLVHRWTLGRPVGEFGNEDIDVELLAARQLGQGVGVGTELRIELLEKAGVDGFVRSGAVRGLALQRRHGQLLLQHARMNDRQIGLIVANRLEPRGRDVGWGSGGLIICRCRLLGR